MTRHQYSVVWQTCKNPLSTNVVLTKSTSMPSSSLTLHLRALAPAFATILAAILTLAVLHAFLLVSLPSFPPRLPALACSYHIPSHSTTSAPSPPSTHRVTTGQFIPYIARLARLAFFSINVHTPAHAHAHCSLRYCIHPHTPTYTLPHVCTRYLISSHAPIPKPGPFIYVHIRTYSFFRPSCTCGEYDKCG